mmetsp:Transcript_24311/g.69676  ORF Transcript_24311/g.69676 Transcript_24311/m.69676 type:complete len:256 (+) Transcript_24311:2570-3337(+)
MHSHRWSPSIQQTCQASTSHEKWLTCALRQAKRFKCPYRFKCPCLVVHPKCRCRSLDNPNLTRMQICGVWRRSKRTSCHHLNVTPLMTSSKHGCRGLMILSAKRPKTWTRMVTKPLGASIAIHLRKSCQLLRARRSQQMPPPLRSASSPVSLRLCRTTRCRRRTRTPRRRRTPQRAFPGATHQGRGCQPPLRRWSCPASPRRRRPRASRPPGRSTPGGSRSLPRRSGRRRRRRPACLPRCCWTPPRAPRACRAAL